WQWANAARLPRRFQPGLKRLINGSLAGKTHYTRNGSIIELFEISRHVNRPIGVLRWRQRICFAANSFLNPKGLVTLPIDMKPRNSSRRLTVNRSERSGGNNLV